MNSRSIRKFFSTISYRNLFFTLLGSAIVALGAAIHVDSGAADGGILGIARIIAHYTNDKISVELSSLVLNLFCYLLAWRLMNTKFILNMAVGSLSFSAFLYLFNQMNLNIPYLFLAILVGMLCMEIGTGIMLRFGSAPNGEDVLSMAISKRGDISFGWVHFIKDFAIISTFFLFADPSAVIYSLILMTLTTPIVEIITTVPQKSSIKKSASKKKKSWIGILITGLILIILVALVAGYINDYYKADKAAINAVQYENVDVVEHEGGFTAYVPKGEIKAGLVFYPGGKVEYIAYEPLLKACADQGILCIAVEMPCNLAVFGINKGMNAIELYPDVENWYIGGHSLGGTSAAICASSNEDTFKGVILLASYSIVDISSFPTLSIYGSNDKVLNLDKYDKFSDKLPKDELFVEYVIDGGNHAYFGMYGNQKGDGKADITNIEQIKITADQIAKFVLEQGLNMKVLMINGSPRQNGNTALALSEMIKVFEQNNVEVDYIQVGGMEIRGCLACAACHNGRENCVIDDIVNKLAPKFEACDGMVIASPVYYANANATLIALLDRLFYSTKFDKRMKVGASVAVARRGGASATFDQLNKYFTISGMPIASSQYWNSVHGGAKGEAQEDLEGLQTMRTLAKNMTFLMKSIELGKEKFGLPEKEKPERTSFVR